MSLWDDLKASDKALEQVRKDRDELIQEIINTLCPVKVGDTVECQGYSYNGKKMQVLRVGLSEGWSSGYEWVISGRVLRKDGTASMNRTSFRLKVNS